MRDDFKINSSIESAAKLVTAFFGSNTLYYEGQSIPSIAASAPCHAEALHLLYKSYIPRTDSPYDDRCLTVEFQYDNPVSVSPPNLLHLITPSRMMEKQEVKDLVSLGVTVEFYGTHYGTAKESHSLVSYQCEKYLKSRGLL